MATARFAGATNDLVGAGFGTEAASFVDVAVEGGQATGASLFEGEGLAGGEALAAGLVAVRVGAAVKAAVTASVEGPGAALAGEEGLDDDSGTKARARPAFEARFCSTMYVSRV